jgi:hypothetical protein
MVIFYFEKKGKSILGGTSYEKCTKVRAICCISSEVANNAAILEMSVIFVSLSANLIPFKRMLTYINLFLESLF